MPLPALYIGRFQPFHLGHLDAVKQIFTHESVDVPARMQPSLIIAIGSAQYSGTDLNPYPFELRKKIIESSLVEAGISKKKFIILPLDDIHDDAKWCDYSDKTLPPYGNVYTGSPLVKKLFEIQKKHPVIDLELHLNISSTEVREKIKSGGEWSVLVPRACYRIITEYSHH